MSIFASHTTATVPIPFDQPHMVTVRKLTGREIEQAQRSHGDSLAAGDARLWSARFRRILEGSIADKAVIEQAITDPLTGYDRFVLVSAGLVDWTYPQLIAAPKDVAVLPAGKVPGPIERQKHIDDLDDEAVDFIATEVLRLTKPDLFQTREEAKAAEREADAAPSFAGR